MAQNNNDGMRRILATSSALARTTEGTQAAQQMAPENREWLQQAMNAATTGLGGNIAVDPSKKLREAVSQIQSGKVDSSEKMRDLLSDIMEWTEFLDLAVDFQKMGGYNVLKETAVHSDAECRRLTAEILGQVLQHNPYCQQKAIEEDMFSVIYRLLADPDADVSRKGLLALSGLVRSCAPTQELFLRNHGFRHICDADSKHSGDERFETKVAFLFSCMTQESPQAADKLIKLGIYPHAFDCLAKPHNHSHEYWLSTITDLVRLHPQSMDPDNAAKYISLLMFKLDAEYNDPEHHEAKEHATVLLKALKDQLAALDNGGVVAESAESDRNMGQNARTVRR